MTYACSTSTARETTIGDKRHFLAQAHTHSVRSGRKHLLHAWTASRPLIANNHDISSLDLAIQDARTGFFLRVEDSCRAAVTLHGRRYSCYFDYSSIRS